MSDRFALFPSAERIVQPRETSLRLPAKARARIPVPWILLH